jgi:peptidoglycan/LPS O-acetylase OafA/YrhL
MDEPLASMEWVGVDLFFALSGYLITGILLSSKNSPHYFRNFYARRTLRLFPLYYGFLLLYLVLLPLVINPQILGLEHIAGHRLPFWFYYTNYATVFQGWPPVTMGACWSLAVEEHFYLLWPLFIKCTPNDKLVGRCVVLALLTLAGRVVLAGFQFPWMASYYLTTSRADSLILGALALIISKQRPQWASLRLLLPGILLSVGLLELLGISRDSTFSGWPMQTIGYSTLAFLFACVVSLVARSRGTVSRLFGVPLLTFFGKYSYAIYVFHMAVLTLCERAVVNRTAGPATVFVVSFCVVCACAYMSWHLYEKHFIRLKDRFT